MKVTSRVIFCPQEKYQSVASFIFSGDKTGKPGVFYFQCEIFFFFFSETFSEPYEVSKIELFTRILTAAAADYFCKSSIIDI